MNDMQVSLPSYIVSNDAYQHIDRICSKFGKKVVIIYGQTAYEKTKDLILPIVEESSLDLLDCIFYGGESTYEHVSSLMEHEFVKQADVLFAVGGGKCQDCVKVVGAKMNKPVCTFPTVAATCAAVTAISIMYDKDGAFKDIYHLDTPPKYTFINTQVIAEAPLKYLWAGIGDTMAKYFEVNFSARNDELDHSSELGRTISSLCYLPMLSYGEQALSDCEEGIASFALQQVVTNIIVSTGLTSILVDAKYNSALAHALFYGLTLRKHIEERHLHGEVVAYGLLVQLVMDEHKELECLLSFYKKVKLPTCLSDLELDINSDLDDILIKSEENSELEHVPYPVTKEKIKAAMNKLELMK